MRTNGGSESDLNKFQELLTELEAERSFNEVISDAIVDRIKNCGTLTISRNDRGQTTVTMSNESENTPNWFPIAGAIFTTITVAFLMYIFLASAGIDPAKRIIFNVLVAFCAAASAAFLGGAGVAKGHIPLFKNSPITFSAVGGIGTFIVVYAILHLTT